MFKHINPQNSLKKFNTGLRWLGMALAAAACGTGEIRNTDRKEILSGISGQVIVPAFENFLAATDSLAAAAGKFTGHPDSSTLAAAREKWLEAALAWKKASAYTFGPVDDNFWTGAIDYASVHYPNIEKSIRPDVTTDNAYIDSRGSSLKGLKAIEYLLYKSYDADSVVSGFAASQPRKAYLLALTSNLNAQAKKVLDSWTSGDAPYSRVFAEADGRDIKSSLSVLVNKCVSQINLIKDERLAVPLGMRNNGTVQPELAEGLLSRTSLDLLKSEVVSVQQCFGSPDAKGISALLDQLNAQYENQLLSKALADRFAEIYTLSDQIRQPLNEAVKNDPAKVKELYNALKKLQILLEVDIVNHLGLILTFSDNDGD